jgi:hypothetical protein
MNAKVKKAIIKSDELASNAMLLLDEMGVEYSLDEWLTVKRYCEKFGLANTMVVTNWINRGIIPSENIKVIDELNGLKLVKAVAYK